MGKCFKFSGLQTIVEISMYFDNNYVHLQIRLRFANTVWARTRTVPDLFRRAKTLDWRWSWDSEEEKELYVQYDDTHEL